MARRWGGTAALSWLMLWFLVTGRAGWPKDIEAIFEETYQDTISTTTLGRITTENTSASLITSYALFMNKLLHPRLPARVTARFDSKRLWSRANGLEAPITVVEGIDLSSSLRGRNETLSATWNDRTSKILSAVPNGLRSTSTSVSWTRTLGNTNLGLFQSDSRTKIIGGGSGASSGGSASRGGFVNYRHGSWRVGYTFSHLDTDLGGSVSRNNSQDLSAGYSARIVKNLFATAGLQMARSTSSEGTSFSDRGITASATAFLARATSVVANFQTRHRESENPAAGRTESDSQQTTLNLSTQLHRLATLDLGVTREVQEGSAANGNQSVVFANVQMRPHRKLDLALQYTAVRSRFPQADFVTRSPRLIANMPLSAKALLSGSAAIVDLENFGTGARTHEEDLFLNYNYRLSGSTNMTLNLSWRQFKDLVTREALRERDLGLNIVSRPTRRLQVTYQRAFSVSEGKNRLRSPTSTFNAIYDFPGDIKLSVTYNRNFAAREVTPVVFPTDVVPSFSSSRNESILASLRAPLGPSAEVNVFYNLTTFKSESLGETQNIGITFQKRL